CLTLKDNSRLPDRSTSIGWSRCRFDSCPHSECGSVMGARESSLTNLSSAFATCRCREPSGTGLTRSVKELRYAGPVRLAGPTEDTRNRQPTADPEYIFPM